MTAPTTTTSRSELDDVLDDAREMLQASVDRCDFGCGELNRDTPNEREVLRRTQPCGVCEDRLIAIADLARLLDD